MAFGGGDYTLDLNYEWHADEAVLAYAQCEDCRTRRGSATLSRRSIRWCCKFATTRAFCNLPGTANSSVLVANYVSTQSDTPRPTTCLRPRRRNRSRAAVVAAFEAAEAEGSASIQLDGYFIDYPDRLQKPADFGAGR